MENRKEKIKAFNKSLLSLKEIDERKRMLVSIIASQNETIAISPSGPISDRSYYKRMYEHGRVKVDSEEFISKLGVDQSVRDHLRLIEEQITKANDEVYEGLYSAYRLLSKYKEGTFLKWFYEVFRNYKEISQRSADYHIRRIFVKKLLEQAVELKIIKKKILNTYKHLSLKSCYELYHILKDIRSRMRISRKFKRFETVVKILTEIHGKGGKISHDEFLARYGTITRKRTKRSKAKNRGPHPDDELLRRQYKKDYRRWRAILLSCDITEDKIGTLEKQLSRHAQSWPDAIEIAIDLYIKKSYEIQVEDDSDWIFDGDY